MRIKQLIDLLYRADGASLSSAQLTQALSISARTVVRYVRQAQELGPAGGFSVESCSGHGYRLRVTDPERFAAWCAAGEKQKGENALAPQAARYLLRHANCKLDEMAEHFHYSRSSMSRVITDVGALLEPYGLRLYSKAYAGLMVQGSEVSVRNCLLALGGESGRTSPPPAAVQALGACLERAGYAAADKTDPRFLQYLFIAAERAGAGHVVEAALLLDPEEHPYMRRNIQTVREILGAVVPDAAPLLAQPAELLYLATVLAQFLPDGNPNAKFDDAVLALSRKLVCHALERVRVNCQMDFTGDETLQDGLVLHVAANYGGYLLGLCTDSPFAEELKRTYPSAYYYSLELAACICAHTRRVVPAEEIAYLTLYFAAAQERRNYKKRWLTVVLCSNGFGTATLMKTRLQTQYENIHIVSVYSWQQQEQLPSAVDFYLSTVPTATARLHGKPVLTLSPFLNEADKQQLDALLSSLEHGISLRQMSGPEQFFLLEKEKRKKRVLEYLAEQLQRQHLLTQQEVQRLFEREALVSTEIAPGVALPHCMVEGPSFLAFARLRTPVPWGVTNAELVILSGMHEGDSRMKTALEKIFYFVQDEARLAQALRCETYESLLRCID